MTVSLKFPTRPLTPRRLKSGEPVNGATLVGITRDVALSPRDFARELREQNISAMFLTAALFNQLAAESGRLCDGAHGDVRRGAGDPKSVARVLKHQPPQHLVNGYGPTENTTFSACYEAHAMPMTPPLCRLAGPFQIRSATFSTHT